jgi:6-pyruvoyltetrahydropterin/6-carboxytetrahydropterin synthase
MPTITATRRIQFCAGHRVYEHGSKCRNLHGHNYVAFITAELDASDAPKGSSLDGLGMVIDFSILKEKIGGWIDKYWDHGFIYFKDDHLVEAALLAFQNGEAEVAPEFFQKKFPLPYNPTAENLARFLLQQGQSLISDTEVILTEVTIWETENCYATARLQ